MMVRTPLQRQQLRPFARYQPSVSDPLFECSTVRWFRAQVGPAHLYSYERSPFDLVIAPTQGQGVHEVDFEEVNVDRHHWLYVRAGQAHRWGPPTYEADLILLQPAPGIVHWLHGPRSIVFTDTQLADVAPLLEFAKIERSNQDPVVMRVTRDLMFGWLRLGDRNGKTEPLCADFRNLLEVHVADVRSVGHYATMLGCAPRELIDSCRKAGCGHPKKMIDDALLLEAKRLLIQPNGSPAAVASFLDFDESRFSRFFKRHEGQKLSSWIEQHTRR